jgi:AcrR family transcriptional regulator
MALTKSPARQTQTVAKRVPLNRERIIEASAKLIETEGLEELSMRRLGKELHVKDMALYYHFKNKDEILVGLVHRMFSEMVPVDIEDGKDWKEYLKKVMQSFRAVGIKYPQTFLLYARSPWRDAGRTGDMIHLINGGLSAEEGELILRNVADYVTGFVVRHDVARLTGSSPDGDDFDAEGTFECGLDSMLDGFELWVERSRGEQA